MHWLWLRRHGVLVGTCCVVALSVCPAPARAERQIIPIPEVITDPNEGTTVGLLGVLLMSNDETKSIDGIVAPDVRYNDSFGVWPTFRYFGYPDPDTHFSIIAGKATEQGEDAEAEYGTYGMFGGWADVYGHLQHEEDPFERFYGIGNNTPSSNETNYGSTTNSGSAFGGLNVYGPWQVSYRLRVSKENIGNGAVSSLPQLRDPSSGFSTVHGADGATVVGTRFGFTYDTRDRHDIPTEGVFAAAGVEPVDKALGSSSSYVRYGLEAKGFVPLQDDKRFVVALHSALDYIQHGDQAPFYELNSVGGIHSLRGFGSHRFTDNNRFVFQGELRSNVYEREIFGVRAHLEIAPFLDMGQVFHSAREVPVDDLHFVGGCGFRAVVVPQVVAYVDVGTNGGSPAAFTGIDYPF